MTSVNSNFNFLCGRPHGAGPPPPVHMRQPEPDPLPLRVDAINGWPLNASDEWQNLKVEGFKSRSQLSRGQRTGRPVSQRRVASHRHCMAKLIKEQQSLWLHPLKIGELLHE